MTKERFESKSYKKYEISNEISMHYLYIKQMEIEIPWVNLNQKRSLLNQLLRYACVWELRDSNCHMRDDPNNMLLKPSDLI